MIKPTVSVIIPTYNRRAYVQEAVDSVLAQTYTDYEIIVIDDGSTDGTGEALRERCGALSDGRIIYEWQENQGLSAARNRGIESSRGQYIALLDSDDLWMPEKLERQVACLSQHPEVAMVFSQARIIDAAGNMASNRILNSEVTEEKLSLEALCFENCILVPSSAVIARSALDRVGVFDPEIPCYGEDYDLFMRIRLVSPIACIDQPLVAYRIHGSNLGGLTAENSGAWLRAQLRTLGKVFAAWPNAPAGLEERAVAWHLAKSALMEAAVGHNETVGDLLARAVATDTGFLTNPGRFCAAAGGYAAHVYQMNASGEMKASRVYVNSVLAALADLGWKHRTLARGVWARSFEAIGFAAHARHDARVARVAMARALVVDPRLARNRGVWSILVEATLGPKATLFRKRLTSWFRRAVPPTAGEARA